MLQEAPCRRRRACRAAGAAGYAAQRRARETGRSSGRKCQNRIGFARPSASVVLQGNEELAIRRRSFLHPVSSAPSSAGLSEPRRHLIMRVVARPLLRACLCAVVLQQAVWASALRLQLGTATAMRSGGCSGHSDVVCWGRRSMCASASDEEPAAEVQSYADRPLMFTDRESEKVGDKGAATLAPEAAVMDPPVDLSGMDQILKQLESIQKGTPKNIVMLGTRHCSLLHQQIIELLSYALVLSTHRRSQKSGRRAGLAPVPPKAGHPPSPLPLPPTHPPTPANRLRGPPDRPRARLRRPSTVSAEILFISAATGSAPLPPPYRRLTAPLPPPPGDNHIYTSGATGTHAAAIRGGLQHITKALTPILTTDH